MDATSHYFPNHVIKAGATVWQGGVNLSFGQEYVSLNLSGVYPNHTEVEVVKLFEGRFINEIDIKERRKVIVLHKKTAEILFNKTHTEPIGQFVNAGNVVYQVVGLYNDKGNSGDSDAYIPFTTLQTIYNKGDKLNNLVMTTKNLETVEANEAFEAHYRKVLGANHRFDPTDHSAIWIWNRFTNYLQQQKGSGMLRIAIWVIGIFTLLSGIVGVSNIMLITVKERTREFGIRKALGAKPLSILWLIIVESVTITTIFGYIGMVAGIGVTEWMNSAFGNQTMDTGMWTETVFLNPTVDIRIAIQATLTLIIAGTLAGLFPARKQLASDRSKHLEQIKTMRIDMDTCEEILITITRNKTRSLLTAFGVFWGIFMLVALIGGGQGLEDMMKKTLKDLPPIPVSLSRKERARLTKASAKEDGGIWNLPTSTVFAPK